MNDKNNDWHERGELPPVGTVCEVYNHEFGNHAAWEKCEILFMGKFKCVYSSESCHERTGNVGAIEFRPIRTEREKFIDSAAGKSFGGYVMTLSTASALFDAGFKAPEEK